MLLNQQAKKAVTVLGGMIDPDHQGEIGPFFHNGNKEECVWNPKDLLYLSYYYHALGLKVTEEHSPVQAGPLMAQTLQA